MSRKLIAAFTALILCASLFIIGSTSSAGASYLGDKPGDYTIIESYGQFDHWDWRNSKDYAFTVDYWNYCGHPETGYDWTNCKDLVITAYIWDWDQTVQVMHAKLPDFLAFQQPIYEGVPGQLNANISFISNVYNAQNGYPYAFWNPDTMGGQIEWGGNACYPESHHEGAYPWCGAGFNAVGRVTGGSTDLAFDSSIEYGVVYAQLWNRPFTTYLGAESRQPWIKLAMWWEGEQPAWSS